MTDPTADRSRYRAPRAGIDPDPSKSWLRRVRPILLTHKLMFATSLVGTFVGLVLQVQIPELLRRAIDSILEPGQSSLHRYVAIMAGLGGLRWVLGTVATYYLQTTAYRLEYDLRHTVYEHLTRMSFSFYDRVQSGQLISRANSDIRSLQIYLTLAPMAFARMAVGGVALVQMLLVDVPLALVAMSMMPFVVVVGRRMIAEIFPVSWMVQARLAELTTVVDESINGVRVVKSFGAEQHQLRLLATAARRTRWANIYDASVRARYSPLLENMPRLGQALVLLYGGWLAIEGQVTVGTLVAFNAYVLLLQPPFRMLGMVMMMGQRARASAGRIFEILDEQPDIVDHHAAVDLVDCRGEVRFEHVSFDYPNGVPVLRHLDLHLRPGETVALVGRTGCGKSTVARLLGRFYDVTGGAVLVDGNDVRRLTLASLRHHVSMVIDEPFLFSVSIHDNIAYGRPDATRAEVERAAEAADAAGFVGALPDGYDTIVGERGYTLSGGQRQRISLARALLVNPRVLVLDDATSAVDVQVEQRIHHALRQLMVDRTTLIIAHRLSTISLADRVAVMEDGRIIAEGTHAELLASEPRYGEILAQLEDEDEAVTAVVTGDED